MRASPDTHSPVLETFSLSGKVVLVTGAASRFGRHISRAVAEAGATTLAGGRNIENCNALAGELRQAGGDACAIHLDISSETSVLDAKNKILKSWKRLDVLVNNAAAMSTGTPEVYPESVWQEVFEVNATGVYRACRQFGEMLTAQQYGSIINIGSIYGEVSPDFHIYGEHPEMASPPSYAFAKGGLISLTRYLAAWYGRFGVRVNCVSPGGLLSPGMPDDFVANYSRKVPLGRMAQGHDIKGPIVFLASDASLYVTGQNLGVDGGFLCW